MVEIKDIGCDDITHMIGNITSDKRIRLRDANIFGHEPNFSRRRLLACLGIGACYTTAMMSVGSLALSSQVEAQVINDTAVLNFMLNIEYLEAEFYSHGVTGIGLSTADTSGTGYANSVTGGSRVPFATAAIQQYASEINQDKLSHTRLLRGGLSSSAVGEPIIDLSQSFITFGSLIGIPNFNPFANENNFLLGAFIFEDVAITAYRGLLGLLSSKQVISVIGGIVATTSYHASEIRVLLFQRGFAAQANNISNVRRSLSGANDDQGITNADGTANITPADANGLTFSRTPRQVRNILYGAQNASSGLFFPSGFNGSL